MYTLSVVLLSLVCRFSLAALPPPGAQNPLGLLESKHLPRPATENDLDDIVTTVIAAIKPSPMWQYGHIDDDKYANYTWTCARRLAQEQWENLDASEFVNVIAVDAKDEQTGIRNERVVSVGAWAWLKPGDFEAVPFASKLQRLRGKCSDNLDVNKTRMADLEQQFERVALPYIQNLTEPQLYLSLLVTHPDWDGHGFGAAQVEVGLGKAALVDTPVTLISTPAGYPLYDSLGFRSLANLTFVMLDDLGTLWSEYMRWDAEANLY